MQKEWNHPIIKGEGGASRDPQSRATPPKRLVTRASAKCAGVSNSPQLSDKRRRPLMVRVRVYMLI